MIREALTALALAAGAASAQTDMPSLRPLSPGKDYGVLVLVENTDVGSLRKTAAALSGAGKNFPMKIALSVTDSSELQKEVDSLQGSGVKKIVVVPLYISSRSDEIAQARYLLRLDAHPSKSLTSMPNAMWQGVKRVDSKVPIVMASAMDSSPLFVSMVAARAKALGGDSMKATAVLVGCRPGSKEDAAAWQGEISALAEKVRTYGAFKRARGFGLDCMSPVSGMSEDEKGLRDFVSQVRPFSSALIIPLEVNPGGVALGLRDILSGLFYRYDGKPGFPDAAIAQWVSQTAREGAKMPDQRLPSASAAADNNNIRTQDRPSHFPQSTSY